MFTFFLPLRLTHAHLYISMCILKPFSFNNSVVVVVVFEVWPYFGRSRARILSLFSLLCIRKMHISIYEYICVCVFVEM